MGCVLAIDHGTKRTGFAVADPLRITVAPLSVCSASGDGEPLLQYVDKLLEERDVDVFLLGMPLASDGSAGARAKDVQAFGVRLRSRFPRVELLPWDEHLTTREAEDLLREAGHHGQNRRDRRDSWSAYVLLQDWIRSGEPRPPAAT